MEEGFRTAFIIGCIYVWKVCRLLVAHQHHLCTRYSTNRLRRTHLAAFEYYPAKLKANTTGVHRRWDKGYERFWSAKMVSR